MFPQVVEGRAEGVVLTKSSLTFTPKQKVINASDIKENKKGASACCRVDMGLFRVL